MITITRCKVIAIKKFSAWNGKSDIVYVLFIIKGKVMCVVRKESRFPTIDLGRCSDCGGCVEVAPNVFHYNAVMGIMEVIELQVYPEDLIDEARKNCPKNCIHWDKYI